jgi:hypothetical protein
VVFEGIIVIGSLFMPCIGAADAGARRSLSAVEAAR